MPITVIVPARNEEKNLPGVVRDLREIAMVNQIVIVEGNSSDETWSVAQNLESQHQGLVVTLKQTGKNKFNAVLCGIDAAHNDHVMIWDADNTVQIANQIELMNLAEKEPMSLWTGNRLRGTRETGAMRFFNLIGNHLFSIAWIPFTGKNKIDTLCGSKIFPKSLLESCPSTVLENDPFGDFSILAAAHISNTPVESIPVKYLARTYGNTNIHRWRHGFQLLYIYLIFISALLNFRNKKKI
jgi:glycosyltransferase involved in cell wall biosynthesis